MKRKSKPRVIHIHGRRWFGRTNGSTYHTVEIWIDGEHVYKSNITYGYDNYYEQTAEEWLRNNGQIRGFRKDETVWQYCENRGIKYVNEVDDVTRRKDL